MDCRQTEELMMDYLYQELDAAQMTAYRAHLATCAACGAMLAGYERTRQAVRALPELEPPESVTSRLLAEASARRPVAAAATVGGVAATAPVEGRSAWGWLTGWMQPIFAHPGFAAAASVVIVAGIAGILTLRGKMEMAAAPQAAVPVQSETAGAAPTPTAAAAAPPAAPADPAAVANGYFATPGGAQPQALEEKKAIGTVHLARPQDAPDLEMDAVARKDEAAPKRAAAAPAPEPAKETRGRMAESAPAPAATMAAKKPSAAPKAAAPAAREESADDERGGVEGGVVGGEVAASQAAPAPPPPPVASAPMADSAPSGGAGAGAAAAKGKSTESAPLAEAKKLHGQARSKANTGDCAEALRLRDRIYRVDPAYFDRSVKNDAELSKCTVARKKAAPANRDEAAPAAPVAPATTK